MTAIAKTEREGEREDLAFSQTELIELDESVLGVIPQTAIHAFG
jgi:hypothetical protein